mmetsp:Transcript_72336/g.136343  ORF Transcript_72336/g.136343 Transcript_72336/m.136343 type:complete len:240 (+) Transcript_72336:67-786(+)
MPQRQSQLQGLWVPRSLRVGTCPSGTGRVPSNAPMTRDTASTPPARAAPAWASLRAGATRVTVRSSESGTRVDTAAQLKPSKHSRAVVFMNTQNSVTSHTSAMMVKLSPSWGPHPEEDPLKLARPFSTRRRRTNVQSVMSPATKELATRRSGRRAFSVLGLQAMTAATTSVKPKKRIAQVEWIVLLPRHRGSVSASQMAATHDKQKHANRPTPSKTSLVKQPQHLRVVSGTRSAAVLAR